MSIQCNLHISGASFVVYVRTLLCFTITYYMVLPCMCFSLAASYVDQSFVLYMQAGLVAVILRQLEKLKIRADKSFIFFIILASNQYSVTESRGTKHRPMK